MKEKTKKTSPLGRMIFVGLALFAFIALYATGALAQTVEQVASEVDAVEVDLATVNSKSEANKSKVVGVESRVTQLETGDATQATTLTNHGARISALEAAPVDPTLVGRVATLETDHAVAIPRLDNVEARVASLEANPGGVDQASHDALAARVTSLETAPATVEKYVARDSLGNFVASWFDRAAVGLAFVNVNGIEIRVNVNPDSLQWYGVQASDGAKLFTAGCNGAPFVKPANYAPPDLSSGDFFGGLIEGEIVTRADGSQYVVKIDPSVVIAPGDLFRKSTDSVTGEMTCEFASRGADVYSTMYLFELPTFYPPYTIAVEAQ